MINTLKTPKLFPNIKWLRKKSGMHVCYFFFFFPLFFFILILPVNFLFIIIIIFPFFLFFSHTSCTLFPTNKPPYQQCRRMGNPRVRVEVEER